MGSLIRRRRRKAGRTTRRKKRVRRREGMLPLVGVGRVAWARAAVYACEEERGEAGREEAS